MVWTDTHAHLTSDELFPQVEILLQRAQQVGISRIANICTDQSTLERGLSLAAKYPWIGTIGATTPHEVEALGEKEFSLFAQEARKGNLVAIGETGLDYHYERANRELQKEFLQRYLQLAKETRLPIVIHCRNAFTDFFSLVDEEGVTTPLILHCFTGTAREATEAIERGFILSLSGIVTFSKSKELQEIAKQIPLDQLVLETDAPYLAPTPHRGKCNEPAYLVETGNLVATLRGISPTELALTTSNNAKRIFSRWKLLS